MKPVAAALLALGVGAPAHALSTVWFGGSGDWGVAANWSLGQPGSSDEAVIASGTATLDFDTSIDMLTHSGGTLTGSGNLTVSGATAWSGGTQGGSGATTFAGTLAMTGAGAKVIGARTLIASDTAWTGNTAHNNGGISIGSSGSFNNTGTFTDTNAFDDTISGGGTFNNAGTYDKQTATLTTIGVGFNNTGTVHVDAGTLQLNTAHTNQGLIQVAAGATMFGNNATFVNAGTFSGDGTFATHLNGDIVNQGTIAPGVSGTGLLSFDGDLTLSASSVLNLQLTSLSDFDGVSVSDNVSLGGEIAIHNLGYMPVVGDSFIVMTFDQNLGGSSFDGLTWRGFGSGVEFDVIYNPHDVTLAVAAVPEPETYAMMLAGLGLLGFVARRRLQA